MTTTVTRTTTTPVAPTTAPGLPLTSTPSTVELWRGAVRAARTVLTAYRHLAAWRELSLHVLILVYGGGGFFFWLHGIARGEHGPAISYWQHWLLDSTIGAIALGPVLAVVLPLLKDYSQFRFGRGRVPAGFVGTTIGMMFAVLTVPGPWVHNMIAGEGKPLARWAEHLFGVDPAVAQHYATTTPHTNAWIEMALQFAFGIPVYLVGAVLAVLLGRAVSRKGDAL